MERTLSADERQQKLNLRNILDYWKFSPKPASIPFCWRHSLPHPRRHFAAVSDNGLTPSPNNLNKWKKYKFWHKIFSTTPLNQI
jgi:hypothetical protein